MQLTKPNALRSATGVWLSQLHYRRGVYPIKKRKKTSPGYTTKNDPKLLESTKISIFEKSRQLILV